MARPKKIVDTDTEVQVSTQKVKPIENENVKIEKMSGDAKRFYDFYANEPRRTTFIPLNTGETFGTVHAVLPIQVNDFKIKVRKGVAVELPDTLATIAEESVMSQNRAMYDAKLANQIQGGGSISGSGNTSARIDQQGEATKNALNI